ncbi:MAG: DNA mismatch repair protein MutS [Sphingobacteriia bacterium]|jgi:DNA mismatch repair ATPase MutS
MQIDKITLNDLSIFHPEEDQSVFFHLNFTQTNGGREYLRYLLGNTLPSIESIQTTQQTIQHLGAVTDQWPVSPTNGTIMVLEKFYESPVDTYPKIPELFNSFLYRFFHQADFSLTLFTIQHAIDFVKGMNTIEGLINNTETKGQLSLIASRIHHYLDNAIIQEMIVQDKHSMSNATVLIYANFIRYRYKKGITELIELYSKLDAYLSLAKAGNKYGFQFPIFTESKEPFFVTEGLYHFMLTKPIDYSIGLSQKENFLFLTGANMAGKSTFIKAVGIAIYLAHLGMGVPASSMQLSFFDGIISNIQVTDNIAKGESFFFNEVQRIKNTIERINDGKKWLILIDELFKGTNQQDAVKCSTTVIEGLRKMQNGLFILSTHLYEIGAPLQQYSNIQFRYFETAVQDDQLLFSYQLKNGVSNDRLGYLILKREGVVSLLENL